MTEEDKKDIATPAPDAPEVILVIFNAYQDALQKLEGVYAENDMLTARNRELGDQIAVNKVNRGKDERTIAGLNGKLKQVEQQIFTLGGKPYE